MSWPRGVLLTAGLVFVFGIYLNPLVTTAASQAEWAMLLELATAAALVLPALAPPKTGVVPPSPGPPWRWSWRIAALAAIMAGWTSLYWDRLRSPALIQDDFLFFAAADRRPGGPALFEPFNEHVCVAARGMTWAIAWWFPTATRPWTTLAATLAVITASGWLLGRLAAKVTGREAAGWLAAALFLCTYCHAECMAYYAATLWTVPLMLTLVACLGLESRSRWGDRLAVCCCLLGPVNFSIGVVAPLTAVAWATWRQRRPWRGLWPMALATAMGGAVAAIILARWITDPEYTARQGRGFLAVFDPVGGMVFAARLTIDRLLLTNLRWYWVPVDEVSAAWLLSALLVAVVWLLRRHPSLVGFLPLLVPLVAGYGLTMPLRTWVGYPVLVNWTRYQLFPHAGLTLFVVAALWHRERRSA